MKIAGAHPADLNKAAVRGTVPGSARAHHKFPAIFASALLAALALFAISLLLPEQLSQVALDLMSWCLVVALAVGALFASVKLIDSVLDL